jgi:hypothetical protein
MSIKALENYGINRNVYLEYPMGGPVQGQKHLGGARYFLQGKE